jgi:hypothetical protein
LLAVVIGGFELAVGRFEQAAEDGVPSTRLMRGLPWLL